MITPIDILSVESWALIATLFGLIWYYFHRKWQYLAKLGIPHDPPSLLGMGNAIEMFKDVFSLDNKLKSKYGPVYGSYFFTTGSIHVQDLDMLRQICIKEFACFPIRQNRLTKAFSKELRDAITTIEGEQWKRVRSTMTPIFSSSKLKNMTGIIEWCCGNTVEVLGRNNEVGDGTFNPKDLFSRLALDIVCSAAFSTRVESQDDGKEIPEIVVQAKKLFAGPTFSPLLLLCFMFPAFESLMVKCNVYLMPKDSREYFRKLVDYLMQQRRDGKMPETMVDLMQLMLDAEVSEEKAKDGTQKGMTESEIHGNAMTMILAGYENTGNQMGFFAYNMAMHPEIQSEVQQEIDEMLERHGKFDYEGVNSLKLLDMCVNETLRLYTPVVRNARICTKEVTIKGVRFPKDIPVAIPVYALAHDPEYWDEPMEFIPERMRNVSEIDPMVFQPFGAGPRNCIGIRFAVMEIKMAFCKILHKYTLKPCEDTPKPPLKLKFGVSLRPEVDFNLRAVPRFLENIGETDA